MQPNNLEKGLNEDQLEIHIKIKKRTGKAFLTYIENIDKLPVPDNFKKDEYLDKIIKMFKKKLMCGGFIEEGSVLVLNGDHRNDIKDILLKQGMVKESQIKIHGF